MVLKLKRNVPKIGRFEHDFDVIDSYILDCLNFDLIQTELLALRDEKGLTTEDFDRFIIFSIFIQI